MTIKKISGSSVEVSSAKASPTAPGSSGTAVVSSGGASAIPPKGFQVALQKMLQGFQKTLPAGSTLQSTSGGYSQAEVVAQLESVLALYSAVAQAKQATSQAVANVRAAVPATRVLLESLRAVVAGFYGPGNPILAEFGIALKGRRQTPSGLQNAVKAAKAKRTRLNNGTLGKRQKAQAVLAADVQTVLVPQGAGPAKPPTSGQ